MKTLKRLKTNEGENAKDCETNDGVDRKKKLWKYVSKQKAWKINERKKDKRKKKKENEQRTKEIIEKKNEQK